MSIDVEKAFDKVQHPFIIKMLSKVGVEGAYLNIIKTIYKKPTSNIKLTDKNLKAFCYDQEQDKDVHFHHFYQHCIGSPTHSN